MPFAEDLTPFFADFGDDGLLDGQPVRGIFSDPVDVQQGVVALGPQFELPTAKVPAQVFERLLVIPQGRFLVREHLPDGTGVSLLLLTRDAP